MVKSGQSEDGNKDLSRGTWRCPIRDESNDKRMIMVHVPTT